MNIYVQWGPTWKDPVKILSTYLSILHRARIRKDVMFADELAYRWQDRGKVTVTSNDGNRLLLLSWAEQAEKNREGNEPQEFAQSQSYKVQTQFVGCRYHVFALGSGQGAMRTCRVALTFRIILVTWAEMIDQTSHKRQWCTMLDYAEKKKVNNEYTEETTTSLQV